MILRSPSSTLFPYTTLFRSLNGFNVFHPRQILSNPSVAGPVVLTELQIQGKTIAVRTGSLLPKPIWDMEDRKSTRLNSSHGYTSYAVFCLKKKIRHIRCYLV